MCVWFMRAGACCYREEGDGLVKDEETAVRYAYTHDELITKSQRRELQ